MALQIKHAEKFYYTFTVLERHLDVFGHMNNATYLQLFEDARWQMMIENGYGLKHIKELGLGPVLLEVQVRFKKELFVRTNITIESQCTVVEGKISKLTQEMFNDKKELCCSAIFTIAVFNLTTRKIVELPDSWLNAMGVTL